MVAIMPPLIPVETELLWAPHHLRFGIGWKAYCGDVALYVYKIKQVRPGKAAYQFRAEKMGDSGKYRVIYDSKDDRFFIGSADYRGAKAQAAIWFNRYAQREGLK